MTIDIQEASRIYQSGVEVGRAMAKREAEEFSKLIAAFQQHDGFVELTAAIEHPATDAPKRAPRTTLVGAFAKHAGKAPAVAKGANKVPVARTKGVKEAILALLSSNPMTAQDIISATGFKGTSVRATLMGIKKAGLAVNIGGQWVAVHHDGQGNSESEAHPS